MDALLGTVLGRACGGQWVDGTFGRGGIERFRVWGLGFWVWGLRFGVWGLGFRVQQLRIEQYYSKVVSYGFDTTPTHPKYPITLRTTLKLCCRFNSFYSTNIGLRYYNFE